MFVCNICTAWNKNVFIFSIFNNLISLSKQIIKKYFISISQPFCKFTYKTDFALLFFLFTQKIICSHKKSYCAINAAGFKNLSKKWNKSGSIRFQQKGENWRPSSHILKAFLYFNKRNWKSSKIYKFVYVFWEKILSDSSHIMLIFCSAEFWWFYLP